MGRAVKVLDLVQLYIDHKVSGYSGVELAARYNASNATICRRLQDVRERFNQDESFRHDIATRAARSLSATPAPLPEPVADDPQEDLEQEMPATVEEAVARFKAYIGYNGIPPTPPARDPDQRPEKILLINDLHCPYHDIEALAEVIKREAHNTDLLILGGDLMDLFAVSRYDKYKMHFSLVEEFRQSKALLNYLSSVFRYIKLIPGNHDERWRKHLVTKRGMRPDELEVINLMGAYYGARGFDVTDPLRAMVYDLANVELVEPISKDYASFSFFMQQGDLIVSHAEKFSRITGQAANQAVQWFMSNAIPMGLVKPFRVFAQTHTHQAGCHWGNFGVWTMECGCMARTPDYASNPKLMGAQRPPITGYSVFYQDKDGRTDMRESRFVPIVG